MSIIRVNLILTPVQAAYLSSVMCVGNDQHEPDDTLPIMVDEIGERIDAARREANEPNARPVVSAEWYGLAPSAPAPMTPDKLVPIATLEPPRMADRFVLDPDVD